MGRLPAGIYGTSSRTGGTTMSLHTGDSIGQYRILQEFTGGANCNWTFAERDGAEFFVKEFHRPKYPPNSIAGALRAEKLRRCTAFETRHKSLVAAMSRVCAPGGNIVMPLNFFRTQSRVLSHRAAHRNYVVDTRRDCSASTARTIGSPPAVVTQSADAAFPANRAWRPQAKQHPHPSLRWRPASAQIDRL